MSMNSLPTSPAAKYIRNTNKVLSFKVYFKEAVNESANAGENHRVRKCKLYYYLEDDTIEIVELKQENSGVPQGNLCKRQTIPNAGGGSVILDDISIGETITIYGRTFFVCGCDDFTARHLADLGANVQQMDYPADPYEESRKEFMLRETGADFSVSRNAQKNPMKKHMEATLGNTVNNNGRDGFLKFDRQVLRFDATWDDTKQMYGDLQRYTIHYFLATDEIEVLEVAKPNSGRDPFPKLLKKARLSRSWSTSDANGRSDEPEVAEYYSWTDFQIGNFIDVYSRKLCLVNADDSTRRFYEQQGRDLGAPIPVPSKGKKQVEAEVPQHNGWGSEADSLASCKSLVPKPPKTQFDLQGAKLSKQILRFEARFNATSMNVLPEDKGRKFVIQFFIENNSLSIHEPPQRNTGVIGGKFLERRQFMNKNTGNIFSAEDFYVGARLPINGQIFQLTDVDEATLKFMEQKPKTFRMSDALHVMADLRIRLADENSHITDVFRHHDTKHLGKITVDEFTTMLREYDSEMLQAEIITLMRHFDRNGDGVIDQKEFADALEGHGALERKDSGNWLDYDELQKSGYEEKARIAGLQMQRKTEVDNLIMRFTEDILKKGTMSHHLLSLAGHSTNHENGFIAKKDFIHGISMAEEMNDSDTDNLYYPIQDARAIASVLFVENGKAVDVLSFDQFSNKISVLNLQSGMTHGNKQ